MTKKNYIDEREMWLELKLSAQREELTQKAVKMAIRVSDELTKAFRYKNPTDREDCAAGGVESFLRYWKNFVPYNTFMISELGNAGLWAFSRQEFHVKSNDFSKSICPAQVKVNIGGETVIFTKKIVESKTERKSTPFKYFSPDDSISYDAKEIYDKVEWSQVARTTRNRVYEEETIQNIAEIPSEIKARYKGDERFSSFAYVTQIIKCGMTKVWKDLHKIPSCNILSLQSHEHNFDNII